MGCHDEPPSLLSQESTGAKHLASVGEILRFAQNDIHHLSCNKTVAAVDSCTQQTEISEANIL